MPVKKKCKCPDESEPWLFTYCDMITLLMCFFILIVAFSTIKQKKFNAVMAAMRQALGEPAAGGTLPISGKPATSLVQVLGQVQLSQTTHRNKSNSESKGMTGRQASVKQLRAGMKFAIGGPVMFEPGSADLSEQAKTQLRRVAKLVKGYNNIIEVRGNAAAGELGSAGLSPYTNLWQLSEARAHAVMQYLTSRAVGLPKDRFQLVINADNEPIAPRAYTPAEAAPNRRVEVVVSEHLVKDFEGP